MAEDKVEKKIHEIAELTLHSGRTLKQVRFGYETHGTLNAERSNAILVTHHFTGTSHAAGRYDAQDPEPGYWNAVIGPKKAIDTDKYFVVSADSLCNVNVKNPHVTTTGPASLDPASGKPYGPKFPVVTIGDFVEAQNHLAEKLQIKKWHAVVGPSMGGMQAMEWAARFPEKTPRVVSAIASGLSVESYVIAKLNAWCAPILLDPNFNGGDYYGKQEPLEGLTQALKLVTLDAIHFGYTRRLFGRRWATQDPALDLANKYSVESALEATAAMRARVSDANSFLRIARAVQSFSIAERKEKLEAKFLLLPARSDILMFPEFVEEAARELHKLGLQADVFYIEGDGGHLDGLNNIAQAEEKIRAFLD